MRTNESKPDPPIETHPPTGWLKGAAHKILHQNDPADRVARGIGAGCFAAAFPLPGFQIPLSLLCAYLVRGNRAVSILPQFISNAGTMVPLTFLQYYLGSWIWPSKALAADAALGGLKTALQDFRWTEPVLSATRFLSAFMQLGTEALGPLLIGIFLTATVLAFSGYILSLIGVRRWREQRADRIPDWAGKPPLELSTSALKRLSDQEIIRSYGISSSAFHNTQTVKLLIDGKQAYPEMLAAMDQAQATIDLETYILRADKSGKQFSDALLRAAKRGVKTRLLFDYIGALELPSAYVKTLVEGGVDVAVYHPLRILRPLWILNRRDHRKILVVDSSVSFTGGLNISDANAAVEQGGAGWRDTHVRIDDARVARELLDLFEEAWSKAKDFPRRKPLADVSGGNLDDLQETIIGSEAAAGAFPLAEPPAHIKGVATQVVGNREFRQRLAIRRAYLHAIKQASHYILIENAYFIPDRGIRRALFQAVRRGVQVAVVVARHSDVAIAAQAGRYLYGDLLREGVRLFEWPVGMMHAKTAVIDDAWSVVGSYNLNNRSLFHDLEAVAIFADAEFSRHLRLQIMADIERCQEVTMRDFENRSWMQRIKESLAHSLRYWL